MLLRFLSIATVSVTLLTFQAINSTETKSSLPEKSIHAAEESIFSENKTFSALYKKKEETAAEKYSKFINTNFNNKHNGQPIIYLASIGQIPLKFPKVELKARPSYLPPIDFISTEDEEKNNPEPVLTASINSEIKIEISEPLKAIKADKLSLKKKSKYKKSRKANYKKYKRTKKYKKKYRKKYASYKKSKYKKYNLGKSVKRKKSKRKYRARYKPTNYLAAFN